MCVPCVVHFVGGAVVFLRALPVLRGRLQLPVVEAQEEHLGELKHGLPLLGGQVAELVLDKVQHPLCGTTRQLYLYSTSHTQGRLKVLHIETIQSNNRLVKEKMSKID